MPKEIAVRKTTLVLGWLSFLFFFDCQKAWSQSGLTKVKITSPSRSIAFSDIYVATDRGFFREEGLEAELVQARPDLAMAGMIAGEVDADTAAGAAAAASQRGMPIKIVAVTLYRPLFWLVTRPEYKSVAELKGLTLGITSLNGIQHRTAAHLLRRGGLDPTKDITSIVIGGAPTLLSAINSGSIQVTALSPPTVIVARDKFKMRILGEPPKDVVALQSGFSVSEKNLIEKRDLVRRILRSRAKAHKYFLENEKGATETLAKYMKLDPAMITESYRLARFGFTKDGILTDKDAEEFIREDTKLLGLSSPAAISKVFDFSVQREANKELGIN
jgi:ABC-type nitrate/sulfonate/bicarbonate transport system substrate-binding protein